jgi:outer membrane receptor for ferrienterochelin and colicins
MKRIFSALVAALCIVLSAEARNTDAHIHGHIIDKNTGEHLPYMVVVLKGTTIGVTTESTGHYMIRNVPEGRFTVEVSAVGYKTQSYEVDIKKGRSYEVNFVLEEDLVHIDGVIVSATRSETTRKMSPTLVNVVGMDVYNKTNSTTVAQGLAFQPGVRVENNCQNCGFQQVRINGLDGQYTQILIDSRPIFSALAGVYGIEQLPANMVDRVEVMRGGGSALFGSSAIAGTINIITKEPVRNSASVSHTTTSIVGTSAMHNTTDINASIVSEDNKLGIAVFGQNTEKDAWDANGDGFTELSRISGQTIGFRGYVKTGLYSKVTAEYHHLQEFRRGGDNLHLPPHEAMIAEQTEHGINTGGVKFDVFSKDNKHRFNAFASIQHIARDSYYGAGMDPNAYGKTDDLTWVGGAQYIYRMAECLFMPSDLTVGLEYNEDYLQDNMWGYDRVTDQTVRIVSAYAQNEWKNSRWGLLIGGRLDKHNLIKR